MHMLPYKITQDKLQVLQPVIGQYLQQDSTIEATG